MKEKSKMKIENPDFDGENPAFSGEKPAFNGETIILKASKIKRFRDCGSQYIYN